MANRGGRVRDRDRGFRKIITRLEEGARVTVDVGWFRDQRLKTGEQTASVAAIQEFGAPEANIPARPMLASTFDEKRRQHRALYRKAWGDIAEGKRRVERALLLFGNEVRSDVVDKITDGPFEPNAPSTIARKGVDNPLIDTGTMRDQVSVEVRLR